MSLVIYLCKVYLNQSLKMAIQSFKEKTQNLFLEKAFELERKDGIIAEI